MKSHKLTDPAELDTAEQAHQRVFDNAVVFDEPLNARLRHRLILYPTQSILDDRWLLPLCRAATSTGGKGFYAKYLEHEYAEREGVWFFACDDLEPYRELSWTSVTNALFSPTGEWGVIISNESVSVLGATDEGFVERFADEVKTPTDEQVAELLEYFQHYARYGAATEPLARLLRHVYGDARAKDMVASVGLSAD